MYLDNPFFEPKDDCVIVWLGSLAPEQLDDYLDEPGGASDNEPISRFCRDLGRWYDHDFIWSEAADEPTTVPELCNLNGVEPDNFIDEIVERAGRDKASSLLILWNAYIIGSSDRPFADGELDCIGCWERKSPLTD